MSTDNEHSKFINALTGGLSDNTFVKLSMGNYKGNTDGLKNIIGRKLMIKNTPKLSFTYRYKTRDIVKNLEITEGISMIRDLISNDFRIATIFLEEEEIQIERLKNDKTVLRTKKVSALNKPDVQHDRVKKRLIETNGKSYLTALGITDDQGNVLKHAQDKYRQINHYIEILHPLLKNVPAGSIRRVADMGAGKGYLTFALYDYMHNVLNLDVQVTGVEFRNDLVELCNQIARSSGFDQLKFEEGTIESYPAENTDMIIALHACDTATDDAIYKGIQSNASLIVVAPCCHKQIRREIEKNKVKNEVSFLTRHGIFMERQSEMATDGIRAMLLEYAGYKTKVFEFISDAHTPKNVLVVGIKSPEDMIDPEKQQKVLSRIQEAKSFFGIGYHHLERLMGINS